MLLAESISEGPQGISRYMPQEGFALIPRYVPHPSCSNTGCQEALCSKPSLCQSMNSEYIYRSQFPPQIMPSIPATEVPRLKDKDSLCWFIRSPGGSRRRSGFGNSTCVQGLILCSLGYASGKTGFCLPTMSELIK